MKCTKFKIHRLLCICVRMQMYFKTTYECIRQLNIHRSVVHCGSVFEPGGSGLPYYCTPPVCVPAVLGALGVWRLLNKKLPSCKDVKLGQSSSELKKERCELQGEPLLRGGAGSPSGFNFF